MTLTQADVDAIAEATARVLEAKGLVTVGAKARLSRRAAAKLLGIQPRTFQARYVDQGFISAGSDKCFARAAVMRLRERGE